MSQLKKGALLSYITIFLTNIIGLILTPFIINKLGDAEYGLYTLIGAFVGYISVMDFGLNNTIVRFVAKYRAEKDKKGEENFLATTMGIYGIISVIILLVGAILYVNLDSIFSESLTIAELDKASVMFLILIFNLAITLPGGAFTAICSGYEHFVFPRTINIIRYVVRSALVVGLLLLGGDAIGLVILDTIMNLLVIVFNGWYVFKKLRVVFKLHQFRTPLIKDIFSYSIWVFLYIIVFKFQWNIGQLILGVNENTISVAIYGVGVLLGGYYGAFGSGINSVLLPRATQMVVNNNSGKELTLMIIKIGRINLLLLSFVLGGFFLFGKDFLKLWIGILYEDSYFIALCIMIVLTLPLIQSFGNSVLEAMKKNRFKSIISVSTVGIASILSFFLSKEMGVNGVIIPLSFAIAINSIIMNCYFRKTFNFNFFLFFKEVLLMPMIIYGVLFYIYSRFLFDIDIETWKKLIYEILKFTLIFGAITYTFILNRFEKSLLLNRVKWILK